MFDLTYKQNLKGGWECYLNEEPFGLTFYLSEGYKPEDYKIDFLGLDTLSPRKCSNLNIELVNKPEDTGVITFDQLAGITCEDDDILISIKKNLALTFNERVLITTNVEPDADGFRRVFRDDLFIKSNTQIYLNFCNEPIKALPEEYANNMFRDGEITNNKNISFYLNANNPFLVLKDNEYLSNKENNEGILRLHTEYGHALVNQNNFLFSTIKQGIVELTLKSDYTCWGHSKTMINSLNNKIKVKGSKFTCLENINSPVVLYDSDTTFYSKLASFKSNDHEVEFIGKNFISAKEVSIDANKQNSRLSAINIHTDEKGTHLLIIDSWLIDTVVDFKIKNTATASISDSNIARSNIKKQKSSIYHAVMGNANLRNCIFAKDSKIRLVSDAFIETEDTIEGDINPYVPIRYNLENIELKKKSSLHINPNMKLKAMPNIPEVNGHRELNCQITNSIFEGDNNVNEFPPSHLNNTILNNAAIYLHNPQTSINNAILKNGIHLENVSSVENSELDQVLIKNRTPVDINGEFIANNRIFDWESYIKDEGRGAPETSICTQELEHL